MHQCLLLLSQLTLSLAVHIAHRCWLGEHTVRLNGCYYVQDAAAADIWYQAQC
jgi:hypothetical protein